MKPTPSVASLDDRYVATIVMYHYVRDMHLTPYPRIKGLTVDRFRGQLDYICRHYELLDPRDYTDCLLSRRSIPTKACLLTFDDGFGDHYRTVWPELARRGIVGMFFVVAAPLTERRMPSVHLVHFLLARLGARRLTDLF